MRKFFLDNHELIGDYVNKVISTDAKIVCFSVSDSSRISSIELMEELKKKRKDLIVIGTL